MFLCNAMRLTFADAVTFAFAAQFFRDFGIDVMPIRPLCGITVLVVALIFMTDALETYITKTYLPKYPAWTSLIEYCIAFVAQTCDFLKWVASTSVVRIATIHNITGSASIVMLFAINAASIANYRRKKE